MITIYNEHVWTILGFQVAALIQTFQVCHARCGGRLSGHCGFGAWAVLGTVCYMGFSYPGLW